MLGLGQAGVYLLDQVPPQLLYCLLVLGVAGDPGCLGQIIDQLEVLLRDRHHHKLAGSPGGWRGSGGRRLGFHGGNGGSRSGERERAFSNILIRYKLSFSCRSDEIK